MVKRHIWVLLMLILAGCHANINGIQTEFVGLCCIKPYHDYVYKICEPIKFSVNNKTFIIPANFETDLASIPRSFWPIMAPAHSSLIRAAIVHDWLYRKNCDFTRYEADLIFYHMLKNDQVSTIKSSIMYYAVRWFGFNYYVENCDD